MKEFLNRHKILFILVSSVILFLALTLFLFYPRINLKGKTNIKVSVGSSYKEEGYQAKIFFKDITKNIKIENNVDYNKLGVYDITYIYNLKGIKFKKKRVVEVIDDIAPVISLKGDSNAVACPNKDYNEEGYEAIDNYDGNITDKVVLNITNDYIDYEVIDSSGNNTKITRNITHKDEEAPKITLKGSSTAYYYVGNKYTESGYSATDNCDGDITNKVSVDSNVNTSKVGTYKITYSVTDSSGNKSEAKREVVVRNTVKVTNSTGEKGVIYLTFDDGPNNTITPKILDVLKKYNVKATFFVTGNGSDSLIKREFNEGHTVALHTASHSYKKIYSSADAYYKDLYQIQDRVKRITGKEVKIIRFPGGSSNTVSKSYNKGIMSYLVNDVVKKGFVYFDWNVSCGDAGGTTSSTGVYNNVVKNLSKKRSNVVLMHDIYSYTYGGLENIIKYGLNNGYEFKRIEYDTAPVRHGVNN